MITNRSPRRAPTVPSAEPAAAAVERVRSPEVEDRPGTGGTGGGYDLLAAFVTLLQRPFANFLCFSSA